MTGPDLRAAFRRHAAGVAVITALDGHGGPVGFTATSLASLSAEPPLLSFNLDVSSSSWPALSATAHVVAHVLAADQAELAARFAAHGVDRFDGVDWSPGPYRLPVLAGVSAWLVCEVEQRLPAGDHGLFVCRVLDAGDDPHTSPLVHYEGKFRPMS